MSVNTYLVRVARSLVLDSNELDSIKTSIETLESRLLNWNNYKEVLEHSIFGSYAKGTILPRWADEKSDVDYMIVFDYYKHQYKSQTYLDWVRDFISLKYKTSEIHQDYPTMVLELNHIKFEISPGIKMWGASLPYYQIPAPKSSIVEWINTNPFTEIERLTLKNGEEHYFIKRLARILKYINVKLGRPLKSYRIENYLITKVFWGDNTFADYFFHAIKDFPYWEAPSYLQDKIKRFISNANSIKSDDDAGFHQTAENNLAKLIDFPAWRLVD